MEIHKAWDDVKTIMFLNGDEPGNLFLGKVWFWGTKKIAREMKRGDNCLIIVEWLKLLGHCHF